MDTKKTVYRFIILIPHRDAGNHLEEYRRKLFSPGFAGADSFPAAAPLAQVSRRLSAEELKELALNIRRFSMENGGKIASSSMNITAESPEMAFFGPALRLSMDESTFPLTARGKISRIFNPTLLCAALLNRNPGSDPAQIPLPENLGAAEMPPLSFRAASVANLSIRPLEAGAPGYSFEWRIGARVWLPAEVKPASSPRS